MGISLKNKTDTTIGKKTMTNAEFKEKNIQRVTELMKERMIIKLKDEAEWKIEQQNEALDNLNEDELDSLILNEEESQFRKKVWEELNADYLKEQEEKKKLEELTSKDGSGSFPK